MLRLLITGGVGFGGRYFVKRFLDLGDDVFCVENVAKHTGGVHPDDGCPLFDRRDYKDFCYFREDCPAFFRRVKDTDFDYCFHLAPMVGGRLTVENTPLAHDFGIDLKERIRWALDCLLNKVR